MVICDLQVFNKAVKLEINRTKAFSNLFFFTTYFITGIFNSNTNPEMSSFIYGALVNLINVAPSYNNVIKEKKEIMSG